MTPRINNATRVFFYLALLGVFYITYLLVQPFLGAMMFGLVMVIVSQPLYLYLFRLFRGRQGMALVAAILIILLLVLVPLIWIGISALQQLISFINTATASTDDVTQLITSTVSQLNRIINDLGLSAFVNIDFSETELIATALDLIQPLQSWLSGLLISLGSSSVQWLVNFMVFVVVLGGMMPAYPRLIEYLKELSPLPQEIDQEILDKITAMTVAMVRGVMVIALVQGILTGILFAIASVRFLLLLTLMAIGAAFIPLGASIVAVPVALYQLLTGQTWQGILILMGYFLIVSNIDTVLRPFLVPKTARLNPALVVISAFGGLSLFGLWGVVYGPVIMILFLTMLEIYREHFQVNIEPSSQDLIVSTLETAGDEMPAISSSVEETPPAISPSPQAGMQS